MEHNSLPVRMMRPDTMTLGAGACRSDQCSVAVGLCQSGDLNDIFEQRPTCEREATHVHRNEAARVWAPGKNRSAPDTSGCRSIVPICRSFLPGRRPLRHSRAGRTSLGWVSTSAQGQAYGG